MVPPTHSLIYDTGMPGGFPGGGFPGGGSSSSGPAPSADEGPKIEEID